MTLTELREAIDRVDEHLVRDLCERFALVDAIGEVKREAGMPVRDAGREEAVLDKVRFLAGEEYGEDAAMLYKELFALARAREGLR